MKKLIMTFMAVILCLSMAACGGSDGEDSGDTSAKTKDLEIVDSGYSITKGLDELYIHYSIVLKNPNEDQGIQYPAFRIVARDADGKVLGSEDQTISEMLPGATVGYGFQAMSVSEKPDKVEFEIMDTSEKWVSPDLLEHPGIKPFETKDVSYKKDEFGGASISGEIVNPNDKKFSSVAVSVLFKDKNGRLIGGGTTFVDSVKASGNTPFTLDSYSDFVTKDYDIYVMPWY